MALSYNVHNTPFTTNAFTFTFDYIDEADVHAIGLNSSDEYVQLTVDTVSTNGTKTATVSDSVSTLNSTYTKVRIYRATSNVGLVDFQSGSRIRETDLDTSYKQALFACQEVTENADASDNRQSIAADQLSDLAITTAKIADDAVTAAKLADTLDLSDHTVTLATGEISGTEIAADAIDGSKIADDSIDSEHYVAGSIDEEHLADNSVDLASTTVTGVLTEDHGGTGVTSLPFTKSFTVTVDYPAADTEVEQAHGLLEVPKLIIAQLRCTSSTNGIGVGALFPIGTGQASGTGDPSSVSADFTNINFVRAGDIEICGLGANDDTTLTVSSSNFDLVLSCYA